MYNHPQTFPTGIRYIIVVQIKSHTCLSADSISLCCVLYIHKLLSSTVVPLLPRPLFAPDTGKLRTIAVGGDGQTSWGIRGRQADGRRKLLPIPFFFLLWTVRKSTFPSNASLRVTEHKVSSEKNFGHRTNFRLQNAAFDSYPDGNAFVRVWPS